MKILRITEDAYVALARSPDESWSAVILRMVHEYQEKTNPLNKFFGVLSSETAERVEHAIRELRKQRSSKAYQKS